VAEKANAFPAGNNRACSNRRSRENKCSGSEEVRIGCRIPLRQDPYAIEVDQERNCYACGGFGNMACHCRNRRKERVIEGRRVEYGGGRIKEIHEYLNNLKGVDSLELLN